MGLALLLESGRLVSSVEKRSITILALFGSIHGLHEWMEIFLLQGRWTGIGYPTFISVLRVFLLAFSFMLLFHFGFFRLTVTWKTMYRWVTFAGALAAFLVVLWLNWQWFNEQFLLRADILSRVLIAIPAAAMTTAGLLRKPQGEEIKAGKNWLHPIRYASAGFFFYGLTQLFVSPADMFPARWINTQLFSDIFFIPIQVVRAALAAWIMVFMLRAMQSLEEARQHELALAQQERLEAVKKVQQELENREAMRRELLRRIVLAQEDERSRISRELHDQCAQLLTAMSLNLATARSRLQKKDPNGALLDTSQALTKDISKVISQMVHDLRPAQLDDLGLIPALQFLVDDSRRSLGLDVRLEVKGERQALDPLVETVIFRITQEALTNVSRHAGVKKAQVSIEYAPQKVDRLAHEACFKLLVTDYGKGFNPDQEWLPPQGIGLAGMRERAESVGGKLTIHSSPGMGTTVNFEVQVAIPQPALQEVP